MSLLCDVPIHDMSAGGRSLMQKSRNVAGHHASALAHLDCNLRLKRGARHMLVGRNGCGKTTLLEAIEAGELPDWPSDISVHLVRQDLSTIDKEDTPLDAMMARFSKIREELQEIEDKLASLTDQEELEAAMARMEELYAEFDEDDSQRQAEAILRGLGMTDALMKKRISELSGGWRARVALAVGVFSCPDLLLLDEPTNHLDLDAENWLGHYLAKQYPGTLLCVSHDRAFIDEVATDILHMDRKSLEYFVGTLEEFERKSDKRRRDLERRMEALERRKERARASIEALQDKIHKRDDANHAMRGRNKYQTGGSTGGTRESNGFKSHAQQMRRISRMGLEKTLDGRKYKASENGFGMDGSSFAVARVGVDDEEELLPEGEVDEEFFFPSAPIFDMDEALVSLDDASFSYGGETLYENMNVGLYEGCRIGVVGPNGQGKSTLLKLLAGEHVPTSGEYKRQRGVVVSYLDQHAVDNLRTAAMAATPAQYISRGFPSLKDPEVEDKLAEFGLEQEMNQPVSSLSGGQCMRLLFAELSLEQPHFLILDEPTNHLDIYTIDTLVSGLAGFAGGLVFATHNRYFLDQLADTMLTIDNKQVHVENASLEPDFVHVSSKRWNRWRERDWA